MTLFMPMDVLSDEQALRDDLGDSSLKLVGRGADRFLTFDPGFAKTGPVMTRSWKRSKPHCLHAKVLSSSPKASC